MVENIVDINNMMVEIEDSGFLFLIYTYSPQRSILLLAHINAITVLIIKKKMLIAVHMIKIFVQKSIHKTDIANSSKITKCSILKKKGDLNALCLDYTSTQNLNL